MENIKIGDKFLLRKKTIFSADHGDDRGKHTEIDTETEMFITRLNPMNMEHISASRIGHTDNIGLRVSDIILI